MAQTIARSFRTASSGSADKRGVTNFGKPLTPSSMRTQAFRRVKSFRDFFRDSRSQNNGK
jgi:hypothetical protein